MTQAELKDLLHYDPETGVFTWKVKRGPARPGSVAGSVRPDGYLLIGVKGKLFYAHRLAFLYINGNFPSEEVDHINGLPCDNRWMNLRNATRAENNKNRSIHSNSASRVKGVCWHKGRGKWQAQAHINGKIKHLGLFINIEDAEAAARAARTAAHGEFVNHGN